MRMVVDAIAGEYRRYKALADDAVSQLSDEELHVKSGEGNSVATLFQHLGGNLKSRFTDFLSSDGEKPWRDRDSEFEDAAQSRVRLAEVWESGWRELFAALEDLSDEQLQRQVAIRGVSLSVMDALMRSVTHAAYHVGQIVLIAKTLRGSEWRYLSIPPRGSAAYNANPRREKPPK